MQTVHERIRKVIKDLNCSEREFSTRLGRVNRWANQLINKESNLSHIDLLKMKEIFAVNPLYILEGQNPEFLK